LPGPKAGVFLSRPPCSMGLPTFFFFKKQLLVINAFQPPESAFPIRIAG
jgi:hypothetical protein